MLKKNQGVQSSEKTSKQDPLTGKNDVFKPWDQFALF